MWLGYQQNVPTNAASGDVSVRRNGWQWMYATSGDVDTGWTNWAAEEPSAGELCASLHQADGKWRGDDCAGENRRLFCEMVFAQQTQGIQPILVSCWASVVDDGPALSQHWVHVS